MEDALIGVVFFLTIGSVFILRGPLGKALADRIAGRTPSGSSDRRIDELRGDFHAAMEDVQYRLTDVEERLDFAERLLAQQRERGRLPGDSQ